MGNQTLNLARFAVRAILKEMEGTAAFWREIQNEKCSSAPTERGNNEPPQTGDSRVMPTGSRRQDGESQTRSSDTGT